MLGVRFEAGRGELGLARTSLVDDAAPARERPAARSEANESREACSGMVIARRDVRLYASGLGRPFVAAEERELIRHALPEKTGERARSRRRASAAGGRGVLPIAIGRALAHDGQTKEIEL